MLSDESRSDLDPAAVLRRSDRSVSSLFSDLASETGMLVHQEVALFKAELRGKLSRLGRRAGALAVGGLIAFSGWLVLLATAVLGLSHVVTPWLAALIVGLVVLALGAGLLLFGKSWLAADALVPRRTLNSLREDEAWVCDRLAS